jgi:hypothetical protein
MKKIILFSCLFAIKGFGQDLKFETLKLNAAPAYVMLGVEPQNIQRPSTVTDFIASAQSAIVNNKLQPNFALETTPYYWTHPKTDADKRIRLYNYLAPSNKILQNIGRSFTLSMASSESDTLTFGDLKPGTGLGFGLRFNIFSGNISRKTIQQVGALIETKLLNNFYQDIINQLTLNGSVDVRTRAASWKIAKAKGDAYKDGLVEYIANYVTDQIVKKLGKQNLTSADLAGVKKLAKENDDKESKVLATVNQAVFPLTREGFILEVALGNSSIVQDNQWKDTRNAKTALWVTPSYRFNTRKDPSVIDYLDVMAVLRWTWNDREVDSSDYSDIGAKLQYTHNRFSLSAELIARKLSNKPATISSEWTNRLDLSIDYKINELITFKFTLGRNFDGNSVHYSDPGKMFAVGGFHFGFSNFFKQTSQ